MQILFNIFFIRKELPLELRASATWTLCIKKALDMQILQLLFSI